MILTTVVISCGHKCVGYIPQVNLILVEYVVLPPSASDMFLTLQEKLLVQQARQDQGFLVNVNPCTKFTLLCSSVQYKCHTLVTMNIGQIKFWDPPPLLQPCPCTQIVLFNQMKMGNDDVVYSNFLVVQPYIFVCKRLELLNVLRNFNSMVYINIQIMQWLKR